MFNKALLISIASLLLTGCGAPVVLVGVAGTGEANVVGSSVPVEQQWDDLTIKSEIATLLQNMPAAAGANVEVTVFNGIVLILGQIPTQALSNQLASQAAALPGVVIVYNQLTVGPNIAFTRFADDSWITSKVKANMIGPVNPLHFKVVTQDGVVYLLGQVTQLEGDEAAMIASQTSGVEKVVKIFNYISPAHSAVPTTVSSSSASANQPATNTAASAVSSTAAPATTVAPVPNNNAALPPDAAAGPAASD